LNIHDRGSADDGGEIDRLPDPSEPRLDGRIDTDPTRGLAHGDICPVEPAAARNLYRFSSIAVSTNVTCVTLGREAFEQLK
jgi:hypothetical protein